MYFNLTAMCFFIAFFVFRVFLEIAARLVPL